MLHAANNLITTLTFPLSAVETGAIMVVSTDRFPANGVVAVAGPDPEVTEIIRYTSKTPTSFLGLTRGVATPHAIGVNIGLPILAKHILDLQTPTGTSAQRAAWAAGLTTEDRGRRFLDLELSALFFWTGTSAEAELLNPSSGFRTLLEFKCTSGEILSLPYVIGDRWFDASTSDWRICRTTRGRAPSLADWVHVARTGPDGPRGSQGILGPDGSRGPAGSRGTMGFRGPDGPRGIPGIRGIRGADRTRWDGTVGRTGDPGTHGNPGTRGSRGPANQIAGPNGPQGNPGPDGPQGSMGGTGETAPRIFASTGDALVATPPLVIGDVFEITSSGQRYIRGPGAAWTPLEIPSKGTRGPKGYQGPQGDPGNPGNPGPQGSMGGTGETAPRIFASTGDALVATPSLVIGDVFEITSSGQRYIRGPGAAWTPLEIPSKGTRGPKGYQGPQGDPGNPGNPGPQGPPGNQGAPGNNAAPGPKGLPGPNGAVGPQGPQGPPGPDGAIGPQGSRGTDGSDGGPGTRGPIGPRGSQGSPGQPGDRGPVGFTGSAGPDGPLGSQGPPGWMGTQGPPGPRGPVGPEGLPGPTGKIRGPRGSRGILGPMGPVTQGRTGPKGPQGDPGPGKSGRGPQGPAGPRGRVGRTGDPGPARLVGTRGPHGFLGDQGSAGFNGPKGDDGPRGRRGPDGRIRTGPQGPQGPNGPLPDPLDSLTPPNGRPCAHDHGGDPLLDIPGDNLAPDSVRTVTLTTKCIRMMNFHTTALSVGGTLVVPKPTYLCCDPKIILAS